jgi:hypothetical protein
VWLEPLGFPSWRAEGSSIWRGRIPFPRIGVTSFAELILRPVFAEVDGIAPTALHSIFQSKNDPEFADRFQCKMILK